jgi:hypothetical protein
MSATGPGLRRMRGPQNRWQCPECYDSGRWWWAVTHVHEKDRRVAFILAVLAAALLLVPTVLALGGGR